MSTPAKAAYGNSSLNAIDDLHDRIAQAAGVLSMIRYASETPDMLPGISLANAAWAAETLLDQAAKAVASLQPATLSIRAVA